MNPYTRAALFLIRMVALGLILISLTYLVSFLYYLVTKRQPGEGGLWLYVLQGLPFLLGMVLLIKSRRLAEHLTRDF